MWEDGLPYHSRKYGRIASKTRGSSGVVDIWSKKTFVIGSSAFPRSRLDVELLHLVPDELHVVALLAGKKEEHRLHAGVGRLGGAFLVLREVLLLQAQRHPQCLFHRPVRHLPLLRRSVSFSMISRGGFRFKRNVPGPPSYQQTGGIG